MIVAGDSAMQLPQISSVSHGDISQAGATTMPNFDIDDERLERRGKWAERIGVGPLIAIISLSIISAILTACCLAFYFIGTQFIKPTFDDQREAVKAVASSATDSLTAIQGIKGHGEQQTRALESQTRALWELKTNSDKNLGLHEKLAESFDRLADALQRNDSRNVGVAKREERPEAPPIPEEKPQ